MKIHTHSASIFLDVKNYKYGNNVNLKRLYLTSLSLILIIYTVQIR